MYVMEWSLITGRGWDYKTGGGGACGHYKKGGRTSFSYPERGGGGLQTVLGVVLTWVLEILSILEAGGTKGFHTPFERGGRVDLSIAQNVSDPRFSDFVAPPLPVINDQSLIVAYTMMLNP